MRVDSSAGPHKSIPTDKKCSPQHEVVHIQTTMYKYTLYLRADFSLSKGSHDNAAMPAQNILCLSLEVGTIKNL